VLSVYKEGSLIIVSIVSVIKEGFLIMVFVVGSVPNELAS
jgi:hypothetical protein